MHRLSRTALSIILALLLPLFAVLAGHAQDFTEQDALATKRFLAESAIQMGVHQSAKDPETGLSKEVLDPEIGTAELELRLVPLTRDELEILAGKWLDIVREKTEQVMAAQIAISKSQDTLEDASRERLTELTTERRSLFDKFSKVINEWDRKGGDKDKVAIHRAYRTAVIVEETRTADYLTLWSQSKAWLVNRDGGVAIGIDAAIIVVSLLALLFAARMIRGITRRSLQRIPNLSKLLQAFLVTFVYWLVIAIGLLIVFSALGIDISPAFALIGGASFILAFAFQDTLGNLASGMMIMINRPFDQGDYVNIGGVGGTVRTVSIVATTVVTPDNQVIVIPNKNVWGNIITNVTASDTRRVDLIFGISYEDSIPDALAVIEDAVKDHPLILAEPEPVIRVHELADSSVNFICRPWVNTADYWAVYWDLTRGVKERFDAAGISIPYPQRDVHIRHGGKQAAGESGIQAAAAEKKRPSPGRNKAARKASATAIGESDEDL